MKELMKYIAQAMVDDPTKVEVEEIEGHHSYVLKLKVAKADLGKVIGKMGNTVQAMRLILNAVAAKAKKRAVLEIVE